MAALRALFFLALFGVCSSQMSECSYYGLLEYLNLTASNKVLEIMRPVTNWTRTTSVQMDVFVYGILDVDEKSQTVTSHTWMETHWTNEFLTWNPLDFCGIDRVTVPRSMVWIPDIIIEEDSSDSGCVQKDPVVLLEPNGAMHTSARQRLTYTCQLNLTLFPFDMQRCNITFRSLSSDVRSIRLGTVNNDTILTRISEWFMITQGEWRLIKMETVIDDILIGETYWSKVLFIVTLERKPMLYVIILIVPLFYLLVLDLASFFISEDSGEKMGFKVTILLSISVLLLILKDILPSTEDNLPMIAQFCASVFTMVWLSVLEAMLMSFLTDLDNYCGKKAQSSVAIQLDIQLEVKCHKEKICFPPDQLSDHDLLKLILEEVKAAQQEVGSHKKDEREPGCYRKLAKIINYVFFASYFVTVLACIVFMCTNWIENES
ncbi:5-hydroxytryptamine receptor 3A-like [Melanotaenia boesemani]|uniref:5-hydroxytryptamine receptor 3A-like n=1 Tax=Melanotaenia boesemani TaxID=1250792 RepID=UPI001C04B250|nr:5-hydroxytryptamine receptor 3A-like [Melanotaenia boesemani]